MNERLYADLARWWPLLSPVEDHADDAHLYWGLITAALGREPASLLELGSGAGAHAAHLPDEVDIWLVDLSEAMLALSRQIAPERTHRAGDMRAIRLGRSFEAVLLHDAVMYLLSEEDLRATYATAYSHLEPGGVFLVVPDLTTDSFQESTVGGGGSIEGGPGARLLEWRWDPDPSDQTFRVDFALLLRDEQGRVECIHDPHTMGMFSRRDHVRLLREVGFEIVQPDPLLAVECGELFAARRP